MGKPLVVIALLDWGLGHLTRSVPIIRHLTDNQFHVIVACTEVQKSLLVREFEEIEFVSCEGYGISYRKNAWLTRLSLLFQTPKILTKIKEEHKWLTQFISQKQVSLIISDNRYGFYSSQIPSVIITHQLQIQTGLGNWINSWVNKMNYQRLAKFRECWVPDFETGINCAGSLSHPVKRPGFPVRYLGALSRMQFCEPIVVKKTKVVVLLSGPEPQRTLLENLFLEQVTTLNEISFVLVRGLPKEQGLPSFRSNNLVVLNHLPSTELNALICSSKYVIGRSGYTSVMDYLKLRAKAILVPTPGQAEQEYLASYLETQQLAIRVEQKHFDLANMIKKADSFAFQPFERNMDLYKDQITEFLDTVPMV